jgi:hypothetical protein
MGICFWWWLLQKWAWSSFFASDGPNRPRFFDDCHGLQQWQQGNDFKSVSCQ